MTFKRRTESRKAVMRKREVIELRHRINCVEWPCASAVINKERSLTARPGKHVGVQEHGTPDIVMFVIPGRPEWLRRKKNCGGSIGQAPRLFSHARPGNTGAP